MTYLIIGILIGWISCIAVCYVLFKWDRYRIRKAIEEDGTIQLYKSK